MATKKLTQKYWKSLEEGSRRRALAHVFPGNAPLVQILLNEKPNKGNVMWQVVFNEVRIPSSDSSYKTVVHNWYLP